jgi:heme/copper-type cytochrome/quinol oxidase subunit 3
MSVDAVAHESHGHVEPIEVVDHRQRLGVWLFIAGDVIILGAFLFTYLYLRGNDVLGRFNAVYGWNFAGLTPAQANDALQNPATVVQLPTVSSSLNWLIAAVAVVSAALFWVAEKQIQAKKSGSFTPLVALSGVIAIAFGALAWVQVYRIPQIWTSNNDSELFVHSAYGSTMIALGASTIIHAFILVVLGIGLMIRHSRGVVSHERWHQVRLVRFFWVWVAVSIVATAAVTTIWT